MITPGQEPPDRLTEADLRIKPVFRELTWEEHNAEREYMHYEHYSPAQRIHVLEYLRRQWHGTETLNAPIQRVFEIIE